MSCYSYELLESPLAATIFHFFCAIQNTEKHITSILEVKSEISTGTVAGQVNCEEFKSFCDDFPQIFNLWTGLA